MPETENPEDPVCLSWKFPGTRFNESLGNCQEIARHSDAKWLLRLVSPDVKDRIDMTRQLSVLSGGTSHGGHLSRAICTMEL